MITNESGLPADNDQIAAMLIEVAKLLELQGANPFRVQAYRRAASTLMQLPQNVRQLLGTEGIAGLEKLPGIGVSLARSIEQIARTGKLGLLRRLRGDNEAEHLFATVANIGPTLAHRIHDELGIETLFELQAAALDGRLEKVPGMGPKRLRAVRESLQTRLGRPVRTAAPQPALQVANEGDEIDVEEILSVDDEYRRRAQAKQLPRIAPRRFNPTREAWLPVLHTERAQRHYTALFSNTARAHKLGMTHDWVIIYRDDEDDHQQWTVITSTLGALRGKRIVRGREHECRRFYQERDVAKQEAQQATKRGSSPSWRGPA